MNKFALFILGFLLIGAASAAEIKIEISENIYQNELDVVKSKDGDVQCRGSVEQVSLLKMEKLDAYRSRIAIEVQSYNCDGRYERFCVYTGTRDLNLASYKYDINVSSKKCEDYDRH